MDANFIFHAIVYFAMFVYVVMGWIMARSMEESF